MSFLGSLKNGLPNGLSYFLFIYFLVTLTLRANNWRSALQDISRKKIVAILVHPPFIFYLKNVEKKNFFPLKSLVGWVGCQKMHSRYTEHMY